MNIGEEIVAEYLRYIRECDAIKSNVLLGSNGGELDLLGIKGKNIFLCEVAIHINGLRYTQKGGTAENLKTKFQRIKNFIESNASYKKYTPKYMFFSPVVKIPRSENKKNGIPTELDEVRKFLKKGGIDLEFFVNERFYGIIGELKEKAKGISHEIKTPVMRLFQIESRQ